MTLTEFLLARIAEDEAVARAATPGPWEAWSGADAGGGEYVSATATRGNYTFGISPGLHGKDGWRIAHDDAAHIAQHDPACVLAECESKRRIVAAHPIAFDRYHRSTGYCETCQTWDGAVSRTDVEAPCETLAALALPYADHSDYREEWRV